MRRRVGWSRHSAWSTWGWVLNSLSYYVTLSKQRESTLGHCLVRFQLGNGKWCLWYRRYVWDFSWWVLFSSGWQAPLHLGLQRHLHHRVPITAQCTVALWSWRGPSVPTSAVPLGAVLCRVTVTTDASPWGRGADPDGRDSQWRLVTADGTSQKHTRNARGVLKLWLWYILPHGLQSGCTSLILSLENALYIVCSNTNTVKFARMCDREQPWFSGPLTHNILCDNV